MKDFLFIGLGGFLGANSRYLVSLLAVHLLGPSLPWGTLIVNVSGSFVLGAVLVLVGERLVVEPAVRSIVAVGFCGAYTTFSSYAFETVRLVEQGALGAAFFNLMANNLLALLAVFAGIVVARWL